jgi:ribosome-associated protein
MSRKRKPVFGYDAELEGLEPSDDGDAGYSSRTQLKQAMHELQDLGVALVELPDSRLMRLDMPERLLDALGELRRLKSFEAIRRQSQFIGKMLRELDPEPFRKAIVDYRLGHTRALEQAESWRSRLLAEDGALTQWVEAYPLTDLPALRGLIRNARREQAQVEAASQDEAAATQKRPRYRELFQVLRSALQEQEQREFEQRTPAPERDPD